MMHVSTGTHRTRSPFGPGRPQHGFMTIPEEDQKAVFDATLFMDGNECTSVIETSQVLAGRSMSETRSQMLEAERRFGAAALERFGKRGEWTA